MARITLQLPDKIYDAYVSRADHRNNRRVDRLMADELKAIFPLDVANDRAVIIDPIIRQRIESLLGRHVMGPIDLAEQLDNLFAIKVGGISIDFTPSQRHELKELADRNGFTVEDLVKSTVKSMEDLFFSHAYDVASVNSEKLRTATSPEAEVVHAGGLKPGDPEPAIVQTNVQVATAATPEPELEPVLVGATSLPAETPAKPPEPAKKTLQRFLDGVRGKG